MSHHVKVLIEILIEIIKKYTKSYIKVSKANRMNSKSARLTLHSVQMKRFKRFKFHDQWS